MKQKPKTNKQNVEAEADTKTTEGTERTKRKVQKVQCRKITGEAEAPAAAAAAETTAATEAASAAAEDGDSSQTTSKPCKRKMNSSSSSSDSDSDNGEEDLQFIRRTKNGKDKANEGEDSQGTDGEGNSSEEGEEDSNNNEVTEEEDDDDDDEDDDGDDDEEVEASFTLFDPREADEHDLFLLLTQTRTYSQLKLSRQQIRQIATVIAAQGNIGNVSRLASGGSSSGAVVGFSTFVSLRQYPEAFSGFSDQILQLAE